MAAYRRRGRSTAECQAKVPEGRESAGVTRAAASCRAGGSKHPGRAPSPSEAERPAREKLPRVQFSFATDKRKERRRTKQRQVKVLLLVERVERACGGRAAGENMSTSGARKRRRDRDAPWREEGASEALDDLGPDGLVRVLREFCRPVKVSAPRQELGVSQLTGLKLSQARGDVADSLEEVDRRGLPQRVCRAEPRRRWASVLEPQREGVGL